jgi:hypothetical protein
MVVSMFLGDFGRVACLQGRKQGRSLYNDATTTTTTTTTTTAFSFAIIAALCVFLSCLVDGEMLDFCFLL